MKVYSYKAPIDIKMNESSYNAVKMNESSYKAQLCSDDHTKIIRS